ncbi:MAG: tRNA lysidine(34) synthetase TilS [Acidobacteriota bacterium]|nr:MAG: tRNA lysidine(34) synthetase TilS [Acidobacteriota bacterium]
MLTTKILRTIRRHAMVRPAERVLIGLSGGPDSVALTHALFELTTKLGIQLIAAHLHHGLRVEADDDQAFCHELADALHLPFVAGRIDVASRAKAAKRSIEDEARRARYAFLSSQAAYQGCERIAVGHTMDDQAETFMMRLARGSGVRGLSSVYPVVKKENIDIIRPLIDVRRHEIVAYLEQRGLSYRDDASNRDRRFTRNRLRHDVLPYVADELNPRLVEALARSAEILRDEEEFMETRARKVFDETKAIGKTGISLSVSALGALHPALRRRLTRLAVEHVNGNTANLTSSHVADVLALLEEGKSGREVHLPGLTAERSFDELFFTNRATHGRKQCTNGYNKYDYRLPIPAKLHITECRGLLTAHLVESVRAGDEPGAAAGTAVDIGIEGRGIEDGLSQLRVRSPKPSDRFRPLGAPGSKPLTRYLMDRKVAKGDRRHVPLVVRADAEEILWVAGHAVSERARLGAGRRRLHLEWMSQ